MRTAIDGLGPPPHRTCCSLKAALLSGSPAGADTAGPATTAMFLGLLLFALSIFPPPCEAAAADQATNGSPGLQQVIVVFKTHFDIGYTDMASNVVQRYRSAMIDQALEVVDQNRDLPAAQQFIWTIPGWPMHKILEDWPGQVPGRKQRVEQALQQGRFVVHALPFTLHTAGLEAEDVVRGLGYSSALTRRLGLGLPRDAKMTDVPEHTWMLATLLHQAGVSFFFIGCNGQSGPLRVPPLFWWEGPDGSRTLTMYSSQYGTQLTPPKEWPYHTWLALLHTGDNHGPPRPREVKEVLDQAAKQFPNAKVRIGRLSDFGDAILAEKPSLPVVRGDAPDTWIHGLMSDPAGARIARNTRPLIAVTESLNTQLQAWGAGVPGVGLVVAAAYEQSLLYGEHTWGGSSGWIGQKLRFGEDFKQARAKGDYQRLESSWDEHTAYIEAARDLIAPALRKNLQALADSVRVTGPRVVVYNPLPWMRSGLASLGQKGAVFAALKAVDGDEVLPVETHDGATQFVARDVPSMGYRTYVPVKVRPQPLLAVDTAAATMAGPFFKVSLDPARGVVRSLMDARTGKELLDAASPLGLGQYLYERFTSNQVQSYCSTYLRQQSGSFVKRGLAPAELSPYQALSPTNFTLRFDQTPCSVTAVMEAGATTNLPAVTTRLVLYRDQPYVDLEITLHDKPFDAWPEAGWLCLPFKVNQPQFHLGMVGSIIDPTCDILPGANRHIFALNSGLTITGAGGEGIGLCPRDNPLVSLDVPGCWRYSFDFVPRRPVAYLNLFNNQWNTNFRLWNQGTWTSRVRLWAVSRYAPEADLITPATEARFPLQAAVADGAAGKLPTTQPGLAVSGKGVLVTAFGPNPDGAGTVLRLWENAGRSGSREIRLPAGLKADSVQPINLRGKSLGKPLPVRNQAFTWDLRAFASASFQIQCP